MVRIGLVPSGVLSKPVVSTTPGATIPLIAAGALLIAWHRFGPTSATARQAMAESLFIILPIVTAALCWHTGRRLQAAGAQWRFISLGCLAWALGSVIWAVYEPLWGIVPPFPSYADAAYLLFAPLCAVGLVLGIRQRRVDGLSAVAIVLDSLLVFVAAGVLCYRFLLLPLLAGPNLGGTTVFVSLLWEVGAIVLLFLNVGALLWCGDVRHHRSLVVLLLGFITFTVTNLLYGQLAIDGDYVTGRALDLGWYAGFLLICVAAELAKPGKARAGEQPAAGLREAMVASHNAALVLIVLFATGLVIITAARPGEDLVLVMGRGLFAVMVLVRLRLAATQSTRLHERTRERDRLRIEAAAAAELAETERALRAAEMQFRALVEQQPSVVYTAECDDIRTPRYVSPQQTMLTGQSPAELQQCPGRWLEQIDPADRPRVLAEIERTNASGTPFSVEYRVRREDAIIWIRDEAVLIRDDHGTPLFWQGLRFDVTERKRIEATLESERDLLHALMDNVPDLVYFKDVEGRFIRLNAPTANTMGIADPALALGKTDADLFPPVGHDWVAEEHRLLRNGEAIVNRLVEHTQANGQQRWILSNKVPIRDRAGAIVGLVGIGRDVSDRLALEEKLEHQAFHEPLTGLPNRRHFARRLQAALADDCRPAVIFLDLDGFKMVNDSLGHGAGDEVLIQAAARLRSAVRQGDVLSRFGGDEFAILVATDIDATVIARRLLDTLQHPFVVDGRETQVGASAGIARGIIAGTTVDEILRAADIALYEAKRRGRGQWVLFDEDLGARAEQRRCLEAGLRRALQQHELELHYQPIVRLADNHIHAMEALVRWRHPELGVLEPGAFIPLAEEAGLILPLGEWVLQEACRQAVTWRSLRPQDPPLVTVNISSRQIRAHSFRQALWRTLSETGISPEQLLLEVTEGVVAADETAATEFLRFIRSCGVRAAMDDFGTGYSLLGRMHDLPLDMIKIDHLFSGVDGHIPHAGAVLRAIATVGHELDLAVTAGGIETPDQLRIAREFGCDFGQGFVIAPPMPAADASVFLRQQPAVAERMHVVGG